MSETLNTMEIVTNSELVRWNDLPSVVLDQIFVHLSWSDKINASSSCKQWRSSLYHPALWKSLSFSLTSLNKDKAAKAQYFIQTIGRILRSVNVTFDSLDCTSSSLTDELLSTLRDNMQLKKLMLIPSRGALCTRTNNTRNTANDLNASRMYHHLFSILTNTSKFEELSIGCLDDVAAYSNVLLKLIENLHSKSIRVLGLATLKCDPKDSSVNGLDSHLIQNFINLQILSINYEYVDDNFLFMLQNCMSLKRIVIHVHNYNENHLSTSEEGWAELTKYCPKVELRLNVVSAHYAAMELHKSILKKNMPLTHLRVLFCRTLNTKALDLLHLYHNSFKSLWWIDTPRTTNSQVLLKTPNPYERTVMNPFIFVAWRCIYLEELVLLGYKYFADDLRAISRLRGTDLKKIQVLRAEMTGSSDDMSQQFTFQEIEEEVSFRIGKPWKMLKRREVQPILLAQDAYDHAEYVLPILCKDLE